MGRDRGPVHCRGSVRSAGAWVGRVVSLGPKSSGLSGRVQLSIYIYYEYRTIVHTRNENKKKAKKYTSPQ